MIFIPETIMVIIGVFSLMLGRLLKWPDFFVIKVFDGLIVSDIVFIVCMIIPVYLVFKHWENR